MLNNILGLTHPELAEGCAVWKTLTAADSAYVFRPFCVSPNLVACRRDKDFETGSVLSTIAYLWQGHMDISIAAALKKLYTVNAFI